MNILNNLDFETAKKIFSSKENAEKYNGLFYSLKIPKQKIFKS